MNTTLWWRRYGDKSLKPHCTRWRWGEESLNWPCYTRGGITLTVCLAVRHQYSPCWSDLEIGRTSQTEVYLLTVVLVVVSQHTRPQARLSASHQDPQLRITQLLNVVWSSGEIGGILVDFNKVSSINDKYISGFWSLKVSFSCKNPLSLII